MHDHPHVVLCENNAALASLLGEFLSSEGFRLTTCTTLAEIETAVARDPASVVVTDSWLGGPPARPGIDTEGLRRLAVRTTVVLTTGWTGASHLGSLQVLGVGDAVRLVRKPYDLDELLETIRSAVAARRLRADE